MEKQIYITPDFEVLDIQIEKGFAQSDGDPTDYEYGRHFGPEW